MRNIQLTRTVRSAIVFGLVLIATGGPAYIISQQLNNNARTQLKYIAVEYAERVRLFVRVRVSVAQYVRLHFEKVGTVNKAALRDQSRHLQTLLPGYLAINWIDTQKIIRYISPEKPNKAALNQDLSQHPLANPLLDASKKKDTTLMSPPLELYQTGEGFTTYSPLFSNGNFLGWLNTVYRIRQLFDQFPDKQIEQNGIRIFDETTGKVILDRRPKLDPAAAPVSSSLNLFGQTWRVEVYPHPVPFWMQVLNRPVTIFLAALIMAALVTILYISRSQAALQARNSLEVSRRDNLLLRSIVHDLGNQLHTIAGNLELIEIYSEPTSQPPSALIRSIAIIKETVLRVMPIIDRVGRMSAVESGRLHVDFVPVPLLRPVDTVIDVLTEDAAKRSVTFRVEDGGPFIVFTDEGIFTDHVLSNILSNALKFSPDGGQIRIETADAVSEVRLSVYDQGAGIPDDILQRVFQENVPIHSPESFGRRGSGFGLILAERFMAGLGGRISVENLPAQTGPGNAGAAVHIYLPKKAPR